MKKGTLFLVLLLASIANVVAQSAVTVVQKQNIPVHTAASTLPAPWAGGLNTPQFSTIDLNKDGEQDLFAFDRILKKSFTWLAVKEGNNWRYVYEPAYEALFPETLHEWVLLRDFNCDGLKDIFTSDPLGIRVYKQVAGEGGFPAFEQAKEFLTYGTGDYNMQMTRADVPSITDMDKDGDLDILLSEFSRGHNLEYYQNMQAEEGLACGELKFIRNTNWWGKITECGGCNNYVFGASCRVVAPMHSDHEGTALLLIDLDKDGDKDLLSGGVACNELILMENKGTAQEAMMESVQQVFPSNTVQTSFYKFPAAFYEDVTFDGIPDMLVAPSTGHTNGDAISNNSVWLYKNKGEADLPDFEYVQDDFVQGQMIDRGEGAYTAFADLDGDADLDMLIGNNGSMQESIFKASISYYQNTGTATEPAFTLVTDDYLNLYQHDLQAIKPAFADLDKDGVVDLVLTYKLQQAGSNKVVYLPNNAAKGAAVKFDWSEQKLIKALVDGDSPAFFDVDSDGDLDFLLGRVNGDLQLYRNEGTVASPSYVLAISNLGGITADFSRSNLYPAVADVDGDNVPDLLTVDDSGLLKLYLNFTNNLDKDFIPSTSLLKNELTSAVLETRFGNGLSITPVAFGEGSKLQLFIGSLGGGVVLLEQESGNSSQPGEIPDALVLDVYPNPATDGNQTDVQVKASEPVSIILFDAVGKEVLRESSFLNHHSLTVNNLQAGIYFVRAVSRSGQSKTAKLVVL